MSKSKQTDSKSKKSPERDAADRIGRLKMIARKLLSELEGIHETTSPDTRSHIDFYEEVRRFEVDLIVRALTHSEGHQLNAARLLNMHPSTLNAKIKQYKIETNVFSASEEVKNVEPLRPKFRVLR